MPKMAGEKVPPRPYNNEVLSMPVAQLRTEKRKQEGSRGRSGEEWKEGGRGRVEERQEESRKERGGRRRRMGKGR